MLVLIKHYVTAFFFDENFAKRCLAALAGLLGSALGGLLIFGYSTIVAWDGKTLAQHAAFCLASAILAALPGPKIAAPPKAEP